MSEFLLELYSEEIPPLLQINARNQLKQFIEKSFKDEGINYKGCLEYSSPTRLSIHVKGLTEKIKIKPNEIRGPKVGVENNVLEGPGFNVFSFNNNCLITPDKGVLEGVTRQTAIDLAIELDIEVKEAPISSEEFKNSREAFATSTAGGIIPITKIDGRFIGNGKAGKITKKIKDLYWKKHLHPDWSEDIKDLL